MLNIVFIPGYLNSLDGHWQELWHHSLKNSYWVEQDDWENPECKAWVKNLNVLVQSLKGPVLFITHSLGGTTLSEWSKTCTANVLGAFMVAPPDPQHIDFPKEISGYSADFMAKLPFPSMVLASTDDPYAKEDRIRYFAEIWGSDLVFLGDMGHINVDSNIGQWPLGKELLRQFTISLGHGPLRV